MVITMKLLAWVFIGQNELIFIVDRLGQLDWIQIDVQMLIDEQIDLEKEMEINEERQKNFNAKYIYGQIKLENY